MTESESVALPLGDAPIFSTTVIITDFSWFVNTNFQLFFSFLFPFLKKSQKIPFFTLQRFKTMVQYRGHLPVAQLDSASDSDSEGQRFESARVGQARKHPPAGVFLLFLYGRIRRRINSASARFYTRRTRGNRDKPRGRRTKDAPYHPRRG